MLDKKVGGFLDVCTFGFFETSLNLGVLSPGYRKSRGKTIGDANGEETRLGRMSFFDLARVEPVPQPGNAVSSMQTLVQVCSRSAATETLLFTDFRCRSTVLMKSKAWRWWLLRILGSHSWNSTTPMWVPNST